MSPNRFLRDLILVLGLAGVVVFCSTRWVVAPFEVEGPSMQPTLRDGERVLVDLWTLGRRLPVPGEVVVISSPSGQEIVKRVARDPYPGEPPYPPPLVPASPLEPSFVVLGDNPAESQDSRAFGKVPRRAVLGRVIWRYWPLSRIGTIEKTPPPLR